MEMFHQLSENTLESLGVDFPTLGERGRSICCELQLSQIRAKITRIDNTYACYRSIIMERSFC